MRSLDLRRKVLSALVATTTSAAALGGAAAGCSSTTTPAGGVVLVMRTDGTLPQATRLHLNVTSSDGKIAYRNEDYLIPSQTTLPATVGIVTSGSATTAVTVNVSLFAGDTLLDDRLDQVFEIPTTRVAELDIELSSKCTAQAVDSATGPTSLCGADGTCDPTTGKCTGNMIDASHLPTFDQGAVDGGSDATTGEGGLPPSGDGGATTTCSTDAQCVPPATSPANCATGSCDLASGTCTFKAKDADGDGHAAASCKATNGVAVQEADDCDDTDPTLYPGHPEACTSSGDGGVSRLPDGGTNGACVTGQVSCLAGGGISTCAGEVAACSANETCVGGACTGQCGPGQTQCSGDAALQSCKADGTWGAAVACVNTACISGDAGTGSASCGGMCTPGALRCGTGTQTNFVQTCDMTGTWTTAPTACADVCTMGQCGGNCVPAQTECGTSNNVLTCPTSGVWPTSGGESCTSETKACVASGAASASCTGSCVPGVSASCGTCGKGTETCTASGTSGTCSGDVPETVACGVSPSCMNGTSHCGGACMGDTTDFGAACGSCGGTVACGGGCTVSTPGNYGQGCGTCGGTVKCDGTCTKNPAAGSGGMAETVNLDFNTAHCSANQINWSWSPTIPTPRNPSGTYTANYSFTDHNNMSGSSSTVFYIGCSGNPTGGNGYSEVELTSTQVGSVTCPIGQSVVWYPTLCGQSGSCCGDPSVNWNITGWSSNNALCD